MTKSEALIALLNGERLTHRNLPSGAWIERHDHCRYKTDNGFLVSTRVFWIYKLESDGWGMDWEIYKGHTYDEML